MYSSLLPRTCIVSCVRYATTFYPVTDSTCKPQVLSKAKAKLTVIDTVAKLMNWNIIEADVTILCVSLIACKPVVMFLLPDSFVAIIHLFFTKSFRSLRSTPSGAKEKIVRKSSSHSTYTAPSYAPEDLTSSDLPYMGPTTEPFDVPGHAGTPHRTGGGQQGHSQAQEEMV